MKKHLLSAVAVCFFCCLLVPMLTACKRSDNVEGIFTGRTWVMTFISHSGRGWYHFPEVTKPEDYAAFSPGGTHSVTLTFTGKNRGNVAEGSFETQGGVHIKGLWRADGETNSFKATITDSNLPPSAGPLAGRVVEALQKAYKYEGDSNNLYLIYTNSTDEVLRLSMRPKP